MNPNIRNHKPYTPSFIKITTHEFGAGDCGDTVILRFVPQPTRPAPTYIYIKKLSIAMKKGTENASQKNSINSILEAIKRAEQDIKEGNVLTHAQAKEKLRKWLKS